MKGKLLTALALSIAFSFALAGGITTLGTFDAQNGNYIVAMADNDIYAGSPTVESCTLIGKAEKGAVSVTDVEEKARVSYTVGEQMSADTYIHIKGWASSEISRIITVYKVDGGENTRFDESQLIWETDDGVKTGYFNMNLKLSDVAADFTTTVFKSMYFEFRLADTSKYGSAQILGVVFNPSETYSDFIEKDSIKAEEKKEAVFGEWKASTANVTLETPTDALVKATYTAAVDQGSSSMSEDSTYIYVEVTDFAASAENTFLSVKYSAEGVDEIAIYVNYTDTEGNTDVKFVMTPGGWTQIENTSYGDFSILTAKIGAYYSEEQMESVNAVIFKLKAAEGATFEIYEFDLTSNGKHGIEVPAGEQTLADIVAPKDVTASVEKKENGDQLVSYTTPISYNTFNINVTNYNSENTVFEIAFTPALKSTVCIEINGKIDWDLGHKVYAGGRKSVQKVDVSSYDLPLNFTVSIYIDAKETETAEKSIVFHSYTFKTPDPEPDGLYFKTPTTAGDIECLESVAGYTVNYTNVKDEKSWRRIVIGVGNYDPSYDILSFDIEVYDGMRLGIRVVYEEDIEGTATEVNEYLLNHYGEESVFNEDGRVSLVYFLKAYGLSNKKVTKIEMYFDPTTDEKILPLEGEQEIEIFDFALLKSSEQDFEIMTIEATPLTVTYGSEYAYVAVAKDEDGEELDVALKYEFSPIGNEENWSERIPTAAGEYKVRVTYMGSLSYDYQTATSTLTVEKAIGITSADGVTFDAETRTVTVATGIEASTSATFENGFEVLNGDQLDYDTVVYYRAAADGNHFAGEILNKTLERPQEPIGPSTGESDGGEESISGSENGEESQNGDSSSGCRGSMSVGFPMMTLALGTLVYFAKRKEIDG